MAGLLSTELYQWPSCLFPASLDDINFSWAHTMFPFSFFWSRAVLFSCLHYTETKSRLSESLTSLPDFTAMSNIRWIHAHWRRTGSGGEGEWKVHRWCRRDKQKQSVIDEMSSNYGFRIVLSNRSVDVMGGWRWLKILPSNFIRKLRRKQGKVVKYLSRKPWEFIYCFPISLPDLRFAFARQKPGLILPRLLRLA